MIIDRRSSTGVIATAILVLTIAVPAGAQPSAQGAVAGALGAPAQAKVATPPAAPVVQAGAGGGPSSAAPADPGAETMTAVSRRRQAQPFPAPTMPTALLPASASRLTGQVMAADGRAIPIAIALGGTNGGTAGPANRPADGTYMYRTVRQVGDQYRVLAYLGLTTGEVFDIDMMFPAGGGTQTMTLPGGRSLTLTLGPADPSDPYTQGAVSVARTQIASETNTLDPGLVAVINATAGLDGAARTAALEAYVASQRSPAAGAPAAAAPAP